MSAPLLDVLAAIADQIEAALKPDLPDLQVQPYWIINPTPPAIDVFPAPDLFLEQVAMGVTSREALFTVRARVPTGDNVTGQQLLVELLDPGSDLSVIGALASDRSFGGLVDDSTVDESPSGFRTYTDSSNGLGYLLGAEWRLRVEL